MILDGHVWHCRWVIGLRRTLLQILLQTISVDCAARPAAVRCGSFSAGRDPSCLVACGVFTVIKLPKIFRVYLLVCKRLAVLHSPPPPTPPRRLHSCHRYVGKRSTSLCKAEKHFKRTIFNAEIPLCRAFFSQTAGT